MQQYIQYTYKDVKLPLWPWMIYVTLLAVAAMFSTELTTTTQHTVTKWLLYGLTFLLLHQGSLFLFQLNRTLLGWLSFSVVVVPLWELAPLVLEPYYAPSWHRSLLILREEVEWQWPHDITSYEFMSIGCRIVIGATLYYGYWVRKVLKAGKEKRKQHSS